MSIKQRTILVVVLGPLLTALALYAMDIKAIGESHEEAVMHESRAIVSMASSARQEMAKKVDLGLMRPFDQIPKDRLVEAVPVITAINTVRDNAAHLGFSFRVPKEQPRNPQNTPNPEESRVLAEMHAKNLQEVVVRDDKAIHYYQAIRLTKDCLVCHGDPKGEPDPVGGIKEGWKEGEIHGAFVIISPLDKAKERSARAATAIGLTTLGILVVSIGLALWRLRADITAPLARLGQYARAVAAGDLDAVPAGTFSKELALLRDVIAGMVGNLKEKVQLAERKSEEADCQTRIAREAARAAEKAGEDANRAKAEGMLYAAEALQDVVGLVGSASQDLSTRIDTSSRGSLEQADRLEAATRAMEQMNAAVLEVSGNAGRAALTTETAMAKAAEGAGVVGEALDAITRIKEQTLGLKADMDALGGQAESIGYVLSVISDIADQTNLLALNAAIEAARAGEAGRGFAVVADEVRKLAEKTMVATKEVDQAIGGIQAGAGKNIGNVDRTAAAIEEAAVRARKSGEVLEAIVGLVRTAAGQVRTIATAAEEQSSTSDEITRSLGDINRIAGDTAEAMRQSAQAIEELAGQIAGVRQVIDDMRRDNGQG